MRVEVEKYINQFNHTLNMPNMCWWIIDLKDDPKHFYCNEYMEEVFSLDKSLDKHSVSDTCPIAGDYNKNILDLDKNKAKTIFEEYSQLLLQEKDNYFNTFPYYNSKVNKIEYFTSRAKSLEKDEKGNISILFGIIEDVTLQETLKLQLEEAQSISKIGSWSLDLINNELTWTNEIYKIFEINHVENILDEFKKMIHPEDKEQVLSIYSKSLENKKPYEIIFRVLLKNKKIKWIKEKAKTIFNKNKIPLITIGTIQDITKEKEYLEKKYIFLSNILDSIPVPIFYKDKNGLYLGVNKAWEKLTGFKKEEIINKTVYDVAPKEIADEYYKQDQKVFNLEENPQIYESQVNNKITGKKYKVIFNKSLFFDEKNEIAGLIGTIVDMSEITRLKEENLKIEKLIQHQSKLASMGEMIGNIAHQWRQPLSAISSAATGIKIQKEMDCLTDSQLNSSLTAINESAQYLSRTIEDFRDFLNLSTTKRSSFNIDKTIDKTLNILTAQFTSKEITIIKNKKNSKLLSIENEFIQVLMNILNNARDALIKIENQKKFIFINTYSVDDTIIIEIKDNAKGISEDIIDKIFEPYFTTKHQSQGTGIGLFMCKNIVNLHLNGNITVTNENYIYDGIKYTGANFKITLPKKL